MIEGTVSVELLAQMYATQLTTKGRSTCWTGTGSITASCGRSPAGPGAGELSRELPTGEIVKTYAPRERGCSMTGASAAGTTFRDYGAKMMPLFWPISGVDGEKFQAGII